MPPGVQCIALSPDGATAWVTSLSSGKLTPINLATRTVGPSVAITGGPFAIAIASVPQGSAAPPGGPTTTTAKGRATTTT